MEKPEMTFEQFIVAASSHAMQTKGEFRMGQAYTISLKYHRPDLYNKLIAQSPHEPWRVDPFYYDSLLPDMFAFIASNWDQK